MTTEEMLKRLNQIGEAMTNDYHRNAIYRAIAMVKACAPDPPPWTTLGELRAGAMFETDDGFQGFKTDEWKHGGQILVYGRLDGHHATASPHTAVREIPLPRSD